MTGYHFEFGVGSFLFEAPSLGSSLGMNSIQWEQVPPELPVLWGCAKETEHYTRTVPLG